MKVPVRSGFHIQFGKDTDRMVHAVAVLGDGKKNRTRMRSILTKQMEKVRQHAINEYLSGPYPRKLQSRSYALAKSLKTRTKFSGSEVVGEFESDSPYAETHEEGKTIFANGDGYLHFQIDAAHGGPQWVKVRYVVIPARPFMRPAVEDQIKEIGEVLTDNYVVPLKKAGLRAT